MNARELVAGLQAAVETAVPRAYLVGERDVEPPCAILVPPRMEWNGPTAAPTDAGLGIGLVVAKGDRSARDLLDLVDAVVAALDESDVDVVVKAAEPTEYFTLPAYLIEIEAALS